MLQKGVFLSLSILKEVLTPKSGKTNKVALILFSLPFFGYISINTFPIVFLRSLIPGNCTGKNMVKKYGRKLHSNISFCKNIRILKALRNPMINKSVQFSPISTAMKMYLKQYEKVKKNEKKYEIAPIQHIIQSVSVIITLTF